MLENFRKQALGFHKADVIDYIYALTSEKEKNEKEAAENIEALTAERDSLLGERDALKAEKEALEDQLQKIKAELADANISKSRLFEENNENRRIILDNEREFNIKNEQISKLIAENEQYAEKCAKYAEIAKDVGKTIMEAKKMAADIVDKAKAEAEDIRRNTEKTVADTLREIAGASGELETLKRNLSDMNRVCENRIRTVELNLKSVTESVSNIVPTQQVAASGEGAEEKIEDFEQKNTHEFF
ncbi:MAG: hypothetical protein UHH95_01860 [Oscillospiraceae bacterium]|nr:hypothetical protein [Oscillospiraceae bacterium]